MAIINRFLIARVHEVVLDVPAGLVQDDPYSSFILDDPAKVGNSGTSDFVGLVKKIVLLVDIRKNVVNTNPKNLQVDPLPYNQYIRLTQKQFDDALFNGDITINENTRGNQDEMIGWVQAGTSRPSLYYEDCTDNNIVGKRPKVDNYFNFEDLNLDNKIVMGPGAGDPLQVIKDFNLNETINNWGISAAFMNGKVPPSTTFKNYIYQGISRRGNTAYGFTFDKKELRNIRLGIANRQEHFDGDTKTKLYGLHPITGQQELEKTVYTSPRDGSSWNISIGIQSFSQPTISGNCLSLKRTTIPPVDIEDDEIYLPPNISTNTGGPNDTGTYDYDTDVNIDAESIIDKYVEQCTDSFSDLPIRYPNGIIQPSSSLFSVSNTSINYNKDETISSGEDDQFVYLAKAEDKKRDIGIIDPREISTNTPYGQKGILKYIKNHNECTLDVYPNFRDKDGDVPELTGPFVAGYLENVRSHLLRDFSTKRPLMQIGIGSDGLEYYSDGNSYTELHGESILGCGKPFGFSDIPEIFTEMYPSFNKTDENSSRLWGTPERQNVELYRYAIEKSSQVSGFLFFLIDNFGKDFAKEVLESKKILTINDVIDDITLGIPDMDFAEIGKPDVLEQVLGGLVGAGLVGLLKYFTLDDKNTEFRDTLEVIKAVVLGAIAGISLTELLNAEHDRYTDPSELNTKTVSNLFDKIKPDTFYSYKHYDTFWSQPILSSVYTENNGVIRNENVDNDGNVRITFEEQKVSTDDKDSTWYGTDMSIVQLKKLQSAYSLPSRWKSMMRPIYAELWHDQEAIKPENVSTTPYLGQPITGLELGDYDTHRSLFGMTRNLYDEIDDAISVKIDQEILELSQLENSKFTLFKTITDDSERLFYLFRDRTTSQIRGRFSDVNNIFSFHEGFMDFGNSLSDLISSAFSFKPDELKSYLDILNKSSEIYTGVSDVYQLTRNAISSAINISKDFQDLLSKYTDPNTLETEREKLIDDALNTLQDFGEKLLRDLVDEIQNFVITSTLAFLTKAFDIINNNRISLSPRRVIKRGSVFLQSKYGMYSTNRQPCPIIFLGFNDDAVMSNFSEITPGSINCLTKLSKKDNISTVRRATVHPIKKEQNVQSFAEVLQTNIGNQSFKLNLNSIDNSVYEYTMYSKIDNIPVINKRIRQYGRNPFLDIFYLNLIPDSYYAIGATNDQRRTKTHLSSTPSPFRYPSLKNVRFSKVMNSNIPSIFPPWWNEPVVIEQTPESKGSLYGAYENNKSSITTFWRDLDTNWNLGDAHFLKRRRNNILRAQQRWSMSIENISGNNVIILKDKTPILDIYFGLMDMHINGFEWSEILPLIKETKNAVIISEYIDSQNNTLPDEENSGINITALERVNTKIQKLLNRNEPVIVFNDVSWFGINISNDKPTLNTKSLILRNNTDRGYIILGDEIKIIPDQETDKFGQTADNVFYFGNVDIKKGPQVKITSPYEVEFTMDTWKVETVGMPSGQVGIKNLRVGVDAKFDYALPIHFIPFRVEPNFEYKATIEIPIMINVDTDDEEVFILRENISAICTVNTYNLAEASSRYEDIELPHSINFGLISDVSKFLEPETNLKINDGYVIPYSHIIEEDILLETLEIINQTITDDKKQYVHEKYFDKDQPKLFRFSEYDVSGYNSEEYLENKTFLQLYEPSFISYIKKNNLLGNFNQHPSNAPVVQINKKELQVKIGNILPPKNLYRASVRLNYALSPRLNSTDPVRKSKNMQLVFVSSM